MRHLKIIAIAIISLCIMAAIATVKAQQPSTTQYFVLFEQNGGEKKGISIVTIEGCEYILVEQERSHHTGSNSSTDTMTAAITHKGNCSNPIHNK